MKVTRSQGCKTKSESDELFSPLGWTGLNCALSPYMIGESCHLSFPSEKFGNVEFLKNSFSFRNQIGFLNKFEELSHAISFIFLYATSSSQDLGGWTGSNIVTLSSKPFPVCRLGRQVSSHVRTQTLKN